MVRHRAGWAYSQRSQRFVDEKDCSFVEPDPIADDPELHRIWLDAVTASHQAYAQLAEGLARKFADIEDKTLRRKKAREAARSVLPNATETQIFVTANARALRHFIEARADASADAEIRKVAVAMLKILQGRRARTFSEITRSKTSPAAASRPAPRTARFDRQPGSAAVRESVHFGMDGRTAGRYLELVRRFGHFYRIPKLIPWPPRDPGTIGPARTPP